jgi:4-hydroxybenzoate polyprenyltransferase
MASHMVIVPMIAAFTISCSGAVPAAADLAPFLGFSYLNFCVFELGRKVCAPAEERPGVETYSALWGPRRAAWAWVGALWAAGATGLAAAVRVDATWLYGLTASILAIAATAGALHFVSSLERATGKTIKAISGLWLLGGHISLGASITLAA